MADIILVAATLVFVAICVGYVSWCDRIVGTDDASDRTTEAQAATDAADGLAVRT